MAQEVQSRRAGRSGFQSRAVIAVIASALFLDYFLYGILFPLYPHSPAGLLSESQFSFLYAAYAVSVLVVTPLFGYLGDRIGSGATMLYGMALAICATLLFCVGSSFYVLLAARLLQGAASAALWTSGLAFIASHYTEKRTEMLGYVFAGGTFGSVLGPVAGGALLHLWGYRPPFVIAGVLLVFDATLIAAILFPAQRPAQRRTHDTWKLLSNRSVLIPALAIALAAFSVGTIEPLLPVRLARNGTASFAVGVIFTLSTLVYALSAPVVGHVSERLSFQRIIMLGAVAMAITLPLPSLFNGPVLVCVALSAVFLSYAFMLNPASAELGNTVDRAGMTCYSAVYGVYNIAYSVGMLAAAALTSMTSHRLNMLNVLLCASVVMLVSVPLLARVALGQRPVGATS